MRPRPPPPSRGLPLAVALALAACGSRTGLQVSGEPLVAASRDAQAEVDAPRGTPGPRLDCAEAGVTYVYVMSEGNELYSFYPATAEFTLVGAIDCNDPEGSTPFSMAVDHKGVAYTVFSPDGRLYRISTRTAACQPAPFIPKQQGFTTFGMGFVADPADAGDASASGETLYVAGDGTNSLASIDLTTFALHPVGAIGRAAGIPVTSAELTGTGGGTLFGFFAPDPAVAPSYIIQIDPQTAEVRSTVELPDVVQGGGWAFGFWGGDFYTFTAPDYATSVVTRYRPADGSIVQVATAPQGVKIVGAGVSTCAPQQ